MNNATIYPILTVHPISILLLVHLCVPLLFGALGFTAKYVFWNETRMHRLGESLLLTLWVMGMLLAVPIASMHHLPGAWYLVLTIFLAGGYGIIRGNTTT